MLSIPPEDLDLASAENAAQLGQYKACQVADSWPTGYEDVRTITLRRIGA